MSAAILVAMTGHRLAILATLSLLFAVGLLWGYVGALGPEWVNGKDASGVYRYFSLMIDDGRVRFISENARPLIPVPQAAIGLSWRVRVLPFHRPRLDRWIWAFDAHALVFGQNDRGYILGFPLWCLELPLWIAPILWIRSKRRQTQTGFTVLQSPTVE